MNDDVREQLYIQIGSSLLGCKQPESVQALVQILRTRMHPRLHEARYRLHNQILNGSQAQRRRWANAISIDALLRLHPQTQLFIDAYKKNELSVEQYSDLLLFMAGFDKGLFDELMIVWIALETRERLLHRLKQLTREELPTEEMMWKEYQHLQRELWQERLHSEPILMHTVDPVTIPSTTGPFVLSGRIHLYDSLTGTYGVEFTPPRRVKEYNAQPGAVIPWHDAQTGIVVQMAFPDAFGWYHDPVHIMLWPHHLTQLKEKGTAVPVRIGKQHDIVLHDDFFPVAVELGDDPVITIRRTSSSIEIRKNHPDLTLTLLA